MGKHMLMTPLIQVNQEQNQSIACVLCYTLPEICFFLILYLFFISPIQSNKPVFFFFIKAQQTYFILNAILPTILPEQKWYLRFILKQI